MALTRDRVGRAARVRGPLRALPAAALLASLCALSAPASAQELSPLPPPVTRSLYRSHWFEFLSAFSENDSAGESRALEEMVKAARKVGVHRLSDFSRTAVHLGRRAEKLGQKERAGRAYSAALQLDDANPDAVVARLSFAFRNGRIADGLLLLPDAANAFLATHEARVAILSCLGVWLALAAAATLIGTILCLALRHFPRVVHDIRETGGRAFGAGSATPLALLVLGLPLLIGFGPLWLALYWGAVAWAYADHGERTVLAAGLLAASLSPTLFAWITHENIQQRSPLFVAAVDLEERREDASAEDGLRQASAVFPEDSEVWFLLGVFAERSGDFERAQAEYGKSIQADPSDYRPILNRGNVHFTEGDFGEAIRDYIEASKRAPRAADVYYNLSLARGEAYDFDGQSTAMGKARELSASLVSHWSNNPTVARVVQVGYSLTSARARIAEWNAQPKSRRLPGHGTAAQPWNALLSVWTLPPFGALLLGLVLARRLDRRGQAAECTRCGRICCHRCRRFGDPVLYCAACARQLLRKENVDIEVQVAEARDMQRRALWRSRAGRLASILLPGSRSFFSERPVAGALTLFFFFFGLAAAFADERLFDPLALPPEGLRLTTVVGGALAVGVWLRANLAARRAPGGA